MALSRKEKELIHHIRAGRTAMVERLIERGYPVNIDTDETTTPVHEAVRHERLDVLRLLVRKGANVNVVTREGHSPLDLAIFLNDARALGSSKFQIVRYLRKVGALRGREITAARAEAANDGKIRFNAENLSDIFNPKAWVGKTHEMEKLWQEVPQLLKKKFDFEEAKARATTLTLKKRSEKMRRMK